MFDEFTINEFEKIMSFVYRKTGMRFDEKKIYFMSNRVNKRLKALDLPDISEYLRYLKYGDMDGTELQELVNLITVNETYFFRDFPQLKAFAEGCLPEVIENKYKQKDDTIRIWVAGCSTGEEAYTISIILSEILENTDNWNINILASDIDKYVLKKAEAGLYDERSIKDVPSVYMDKYFNVVNNTYAVKDFMKKNIHFEHLNLSIKSDMIRRKNFDFIFCRNVLIYFDEISRKQVVDHFYIALKKGGFIFLGSSESLGRMTSSFKIKRVSNYLVYYKE